jgi:hypothetical protein
MSDRNEASASAVPPCRGLPPLAGVATMEQVMRPGLGVEESVARIKRYHFALKRLHQIFTARITAEPIYELKTAFSLHAWLCAEHAQACRTRVGEMREPPLGLDDVPHSNLEIFFDEILASPTTEELVNSTYGVALPALRAAMHRHLDQTNPLADHPTVRMCRIALMEIEQMLDFGARAIESLVGVDQRASMRSWLALLHDCLAAAGGLDGADTPKAVKIERRYSKTPYAYDRVPRRDERFIDLFNRGVDVETFLYDESMPTNARTLMLYYKRLREIDVPEVMASIMTETRGKPWEYYRQMSRQLWDEARHAMMGEVGFNAAGVDWRTIPIAWTWSMDLNTRLNPLECHAVLYYIEQGLMPRSGKRYEWEVGVKSGDPLAALFQDYDWADEVLHAAIGRTWFVKELEDPKQATAMGEAAWGRAVSDWHQLKSSGLTEHRNWWPDVYAQACKRWGIEPDAKALAYDKSYGEQRENKTQPVGASG